MTRKWNKVSLDSFGVITLDFFELMWSHAELFRLVLFLDRTWCNKSQGKTLVLSSFISQKLQSSQQMNIYICLSIHEFVKVALICKKCVFIFRQHLAYILCFGTSITFVECCNFLLFGCWLSLWGRKNTQATVHETRAVGCFGLNLCRLERARENYSG